MLTKHSPRTDTDHDALALVLDEHLENHGMGRPTAFSDELGPPQAPSPQAPPNSEAPSPEAPSP